MSCQALAAALTSCRAEDFALGLAAGRGFDGEIKTAVKLGVTEKEIDKLCDAVVTALEKGPLDPDGLREATGKAVRNLGPEGKKKGLTTTLPVALGKLQESGDIRRVSHQRPLRSTALSICAVASEPAAWFQTVARTNPH